MTAGDAAPYTVNLSGRDTVNWFFQDKPLQVKRVEDVNMVIPLFEVEHLTHFQGCRAKVLEEPRRVDLHIYIDGCTHSPSVYRDIK